MADKYVPRLRTKYDSEIAKAMQEKFGYKNALEIPRIEKITLGADGAPKGVEPLDGE